jgi:tRNA-2-methylthio-N6-dimethylallyladenosine synthase
LQSGDDEILRKMNRGYSSQDYERLIQRIRAKVPEIKISTDLIVGFPGESRKQFENTLRLCKKLGFNKAYIAKYSPRPGTAASYLEDDVPEKEKKYRWKVLENLINPLVKKSK